MKKTKTFFTTSALFLSLTLSGQNKTYIGIEAAITNDKYKMSEENSRIYPSHCVAGLLGFNIRQDLNNCFSLESGLMFKFYQKGIGVKGHSYYYNSSGVMDTWQIPLRINARFNLKSDIVFLKPTIGYHICFNNSYYSSSGSGGAIFENGEIPVFSYDEETNTSLTKSFSLLETGLGLELKLSGKSLLTFSASYYTGFKNVIESNIVYQINVGQPHFTMMSSKGNYLSYCVGFRIPVSGIWQKN